MKYFVPRQQCKGNPVLRIHGNTKWIYTAQSYMQVNNRKYCCLSTATMQTQTCHNVTLYVHCLSI